MQELDTVSLHASIGKNAIANGGRGAPFVGNSQDLIPHAADPGRNEGPSGIITLPTLQSSIISHTILVHLLSSEVAPRSGPV